jgi:hypothetical protein
MRDSSGNPVLPSRKAVTRPLILVYPCMGDGTTTINNLAREMEKSLGWC